MRQVAIIGIGQTTVGEHWDLSVKDLAGQAVLAAMQDAGRESVDGIFVGNMLSGILSKQENIGAMVADWVGVLGIETMKVEAACGSGASAVRMGMIAVASGHLQSAIVVGVEKMTENLSVETTAALSTAADADYEAAMGLSFVAINALVMKRYLHTYKWKHTDFSNFSINAHSNAMSNPYARLHTRITQEEYNKARMVAAPINLLDASPIGDGAAAVLIVPTETLFSTSKPVISIVGSASSTDSIAIHSRKDPLWLSASEKSARKAYSQAGIEPKDVDVFELHDAFSIMSALSLEACGFAERGRAGARGCPATRAARG